MTINFDTLTSHQQDVLGQVATNNDGGHRIKTLQALINKGLIEEYKESYGLMQVRRYRVPLPVHIQWCEWCAAAEDDDEDF